MAILSQRTRGDLLELVVDTNPILGGYPAPIGSTLCFNDSGSGETYTKTGNADANWTRNLTYYDYATLISLINPTFKLIAPPVSVDLTGTPGVLNMHTIPFGLNAGCIVTDIFLACGTAITGTAKSATIKIGTAGNSYDELLGSGGYTFNTATATSLPPLSGVTLMSRIAGITTASTIPIGMFPPNMGGTVLSLSWSGDTMDTGGLYLGLVGVES